MGKGYLIDTNVVIGFLGGSLFQVAKDLLFDMEPAISVITAIELFNSNNTPPNELLLLHAFVDVATVYDKIDEQIVQKAIDIRRQYKTKTPDAIIAATAIVCGLTLLTRNTSDFKKIEELISINPWEM